MYPASSNGLNKETNDAVYFFTPAFYPLDSFSAHTIDLWGIQFPTAEHAYHWKKFAENHPNIAGKILAAKSPQAAKDVADKNKLNLPVSWHDKKVAVMEEIFRAKAEQHSDVREILKKTGNRKIIENSPVDAFWGAGPNEDGKNVIGQLWMKIRDELRKR
jgi:ribA/ribD-fused uncharacterized protein